MFYSTEEYNFQVQELMDLEHYSWAEACGIVHERMEQDEREYAEWVDEQSKQHEQDLEFFEMEVL